MTDGISTKWLEVFNAEVKRVQEESGKPPEEWKAAGRVTVANPNGEDVQFWQHDGLRQIKEYVKWIEQSGWQIATMPDGRPGIEWSADVHFGGTPVRFIIDAIYQVGEDLVIVDYKTGARTPFGMIQMGLYASGIEKIYGIRPKWGAFYMTRKGTLSDLHALSHLSIDYFEYVFETMNTNIQLGYYPPSVGDSCRTCSFVDKCPAMGSNEYPLVLPKKRKVKK